VTFTHKLLKTSIAQKGKVTPSLQGKAVSNLKRVYSLQEKEDQLVVLCLRRGESKLPSLEKGGRFWRERSLVYLLKKSVKSLSCQEKGVNPLDAGKRGFEYRESEDL